MRKIIRFFKRLFSLGFSSRDGFDSIPREKRNALVVGIEYSLKFGSCPGARRDSNQMKKLLSDKVKTIRILQDNAATKEALKTQMTALVEKTEPDGIFIMTYSGHGGSERFKDTDRKLEPDGKDEFLCCFDGYLKDDEIWEIVSHCRGKVLLIFDCCHSETMFRAPIIPPADLVKQDDLAGASARDGSIPDAPVDMLVWSGCPDDTFSYGDTNGGLFTNALLNAVKVKKTYKEIWNSIVKSGLLAQYHQKPQQTVLGNFDVDNEIWN